MRRTWISLALALAAVAIAPRSGLGGGRSGGLRHSPSTGPRSSSVGGKATYTVVITNAGPGTEAAKMRLTRGRGATNVEQGEPLRTTSQSATQGTCFSDKKGVICRVGEIKPGDTVKVRVGRQGLRLGHPESADSGDRAARPRHDDRPERRQRPRRGRHHGARADHGGRRAEGCAKQPFRVKVQGRRAEGGQDEGDRRRQDDRDELEGSSFSFKVKSEEARQGQALAQDRRPAKEGRPLATLKRKFKTC